MKKIYILALAVGAFSFSSYAQIDLEDNFDSYSLGGLTAQADHWRTWSGDEGTEEDGVVTDSRSQSGSQSLLIPGNYATDVILLFPYGADQGIYTVQYSAYIPAGKSGYFNMQAALTADGVEWEQALMGGNVYFNCDGASGGSGGASGQIDCSAFDQAFSYPEDQWFQVRCVYDIDNQSWDMYIDGNQVIFGYPFEFDDRVFEVLAGMDFYSSSEELNTEMYIDDVKLAVGLLGTEDFDTNTFSVYPNPVKDVLNIESKESIDNVTIYDILGKVVLQENPGIISPAIDMSSLATGSYLVKVTIGSTTKTVKILK